MRKLSEIKGEEALDVLAEIIVPITNIANDEEVRAGFSTNIAMCASIAIKKYKNEVLDILAAIDGVERKDLEINLLTLPAVLMEILSEPMVQNLFQ